MAEINGKIEQPGVPHGCLDLITKDGLVLGWAWYPDRPEARLDIELLIDGVAAGTTTAGLFRADVAQAGIGEGFYGFSWPLPFSVMSLARDVTVAARDIQTGTMLPQPRIFKQKVVGDALQKIEELENDLRLLRGTIEGMTSRSSEDGRDSAALFRIVADFFTELAASADGLKPPPRLLKTAVADVSALAPLNFTVCAAPEITIFVEARGSVAAVHATLEALARTLGTAAAEVLLVDGGGCDDAALLPLVVRNLRYARFPGRAAVALPNAAMRLAAGDIAVFVGAGVLPAVSWREGLAAFSAQAGMAALAAQLCGPNGDVLSSGVTLRGGEVLPRRQTSTADAAFSAPMETVDAAAPAFFALRRESWMRLGGFDEGFTALGPALVEFCLRARAAGEVVGYDPVFAAVQNMMPESLESGADRLRLREVIEEVGRAA